MKLPKWHVSALLNDPINLCRCSIWIILLKRIFFISVNLSKSSKSPGGTWVRVGVNGRRQAVSDRVKWPCDAPVEAKCRRSRSHPADYFFVVVMMKGAAAKKEGKWCPICEEKKIRDNTRFISSYCPLHHYRLLLAALVSFLFQKFKKIQFLLQRWNWNFKF